MTLEDQLLKSTVGRDMERYSAKAREGLTFFWVVYWCFRVLTREVPLRSDTDLVSKLTVMPEFMWLLGFHSVTCGLSPVPVQHASRRLPVMFTVVTATCLLTKNQLTFVTYIFSFRIQ